MAHALVRHDGHAFFDRLVEVRFTVSPSIRRVDAAPFLPNDPGTTGRSGGWAEQQWNFTGPFGVRAPEVRYRKDFASARS